MDKTTYLKLKTEREKIASLNKFQKENFCYTCFRLSKICLCHLIKSFETNAHFVLLMHPMEAKKEKIGTGRISRASLKNSSMITGIDFTNNEEVNCLINDPNNYCVVLYPGAHSLNISIDDITPLKNLKNEDRHLVVFLIDGTWPCAKKMMKLSKNLQSLPRVSFTATHQSIFDIKEQPADYCLSTLESIHFFITECNRRGLENTNKSEDQMLNVFRAMIDFQIKCANDPELPNYRGGKRGFSTKAERVRAKKWASRNIVLAD